MKRLNRAKQLIEDIEKIETNKKLQRTIKFTLFVCTIIILAVIRVQIYGQNKVVVGCSYLDPITIDFLAFFAALFLFVEGFARILEHPGASIKRQLTRIIRIAFGCSIMTLHIIQFLHK